MAKTHSAVGTSLNSIPAHSLGKTSLRKRHADVSLNDLEFPSSLIFAGFVGLLRQHMFCG